MSKPFKYERVQRVRHIEEELAREEYLSYERIAQQAEDSVDAMQAEIERAQQELGETRMFRRVPPEELLTAQTTLESLDSTLAEQRRRAQDLRREAEQLRAVWEGKRSEAKTLDRLEERFETAAREEQRQTEARVIDELALRGPNRTLLTEPVGGGAGQGTGQGAGEAVQNGHSGVREAPDTPRSSRGGPPTDEEGPRNHA